MKKIPPFYENFDNTHCAQCVLRGIVEYFEPDQIWDWDEWDRFTNKLPNKWTWAYRGNINMIGRGYHIVAITNANLHRYVELGIYDALVELLGKDVADKQREMADLDEVMVDLKEYLNSTKVTRYQRRPTIDDVRELLRDGYLISSNINGKALHGKEGYSSHFVLVYDIDDEYIYIQDSGPNSTPETKLKIEAFLKYCKTESENQWSFVAYKLEK